MVGGDISAIESHRIQLTIGLARLPHRNFLSARLVEEEEKNHSIIDT